MFVRVLKGLFTTRTGWTIVAGLVVIGAAAAAKFYTEQHSAPERVVAADGLEEILAAVPEALEVYQSAHPEGVLDEAAWTPAVVDCGRSAQATEAERANPTWSTLGIALDKPTRYQFRFHSHDAKWQLLARTDSDCDGLYEVYQLQGNTDWSGHHTDSLKIDNPGE